MGSAAITAESVLVQANGEYPVALQTVISERNALQNQNALLWKHVEKIKSTAGAFKKDLDRVRAERDRLLTLLEKVSPGEVPRKGSSQRSASVDAASISGPADRPVVVRNLSDTGKCYLTGPCMYR